MSELFLALWREQTPVLLAAALVLAVLLHRFLPADRATVRHTLLLFLMCLLLEVVAAVFTLRAQATIAAGLHEAATLGQGVVLIRLAGLGLFRVLLPALRAPTPRIVEDVVVIGGYLLWGLIRLSWAGVELSSLVATSAVITAVLAFAMQDTLGNILGGLALQLDNSLQIGDWVRVDEVCGRVVQIQWRYTAILTRNGERVVVPNAQLMKGKFVVIGQPDADAGAAGWRRWIGFNIEYGASPSRVIAEAERSTAQAEIPNVAHAPPPSCVLMAFEPGSVRYALRYWLLDPRDDDATDSAVRVHLLATVQRNGWRIALPDQRVHLVEDSAAHREAVRQRELARRLTALEGIELFAALDESERHKLAERLLPAPFARGDMVTRQGSTAHWLYIIVSGEAEVVWEAPDGERRLLTRLQPGSIFGEMGLMTGAPRAASVVAASELECYRLDKADFEEVIRERPAIAEGMAQILAQRQRQNEAMRGEYLEAHKKPVVHRAAILERMREFFGLD